MSRENRTHLRTWRAWAIAAVAVVAAGGVYAYETYERERQAKVWEELLSGADCDVCAARKQGIAKKQAERRAQEASAQTGTQ